MGPKLYKRGPSPILPWKYLPVLFDRRVPGVYIPFLGTDPHVIKRRTFLSGCPLIVGCRYTADADSVGSAVCGSSICLLFQGGLGSSFPC